MTSKTHAIIWLDHAQARIILFDSETSLTRVIRPQGGTPHLHHKANSIGAGHVPEDQRYLHEVGQALKGAAAVLIAGPASAKVELIKHISRHDALLLERVSGIETADHPTDGQLLDHGRRYFSSTDGTAVRRV